MKIEINGKLEDISAMLVSAERYALGRRTYIAQWTCEFIVNNLDLLLEKDKKVILTDIYKQKGYGYGDDCDEVEWKKLMRVLEKDLEEKNNK